MTVALLAQAIGFAFGTGAVLLLLMTAFASTKSVARQLWPVLGTEAAILAAGLLPWFLPPLGLLAALLVAAGRIGLESGTVHGLTLGSDVRIGCSVLLILVGAFSWFASTPVFLWSATLLMLAALVTVRLTNRKTFARCSAQFAVFPLLPLAAFCHVASDRAFIPIMVLAFFLVEIFDSFSLLGGKLYGRTPLVPQLSPRKTWEGLATGLAATALAILLLAAWLGMELLPMLLGGVVVVAAAIAGDLLGSAAKRQAGVKDYPAVMKLQGGLLDITDAWLIAGPCLAATSTLLTIN